MFFCRSFHLLLDALPAAFERLDLFICLLLLLSLLLRLPSLSRTCSLYSFLVKNCICSHGHMVTITVFVTLIFVIPCVTVAVFVFLVNCLLLFFCYSAFVDVFFCFC